MRGINKAFIFFYFLQMFPSDQTYTGIDVNKINRMDSKSNGVDIFYTCLSHEFSHLLVIYSLVASRQKFGPETHGTILYDHRLRASDKNHTLIDPWPGAMLKYGP